MTIVRASDAISLGAARGLPVTSFTGDRIVAQSALDDDASVPRGYGRRGGRRSVVDIPSVYGPVRQRGVPSSRVRHVGTTPIDGRRSLDRMRDEIDRVGFSASRGHIHALAPLYPAYDPARRVPIGSTLAAGVIESSRDITGDASHHPLPARLGVLGPGGAAPIQSMAPTQYMMAAPLAPSLPIGPGGAIQPGLRSPMNPNTQVSVPTGGGGAMPGTSTGAAAVQQGGYMIFVAPPPRPSLPTAPVPSHQQVGRQIPSIIGTPAQHTTSTQPPPFPSTASPWGDAGSERIGEAATPSEGPPKGLVVAGVGLAALVAAWAMKKRKRRR